jgi:hypothetical protein
MKTEPPKRRCRVRLVKVPAALYSESLSHLTELCHELRLVQLARDRNAETHRERELAELIDALLEAYAASRNAVELEVAAAVQEGRDHVDLEIELSPTAADDATAMLELLDQADELSRAKRLLTLPARPEVVALRRWTVEQITGQLRDGRPPAPCPL